METYLIQNDPNRFGFIVEINIESHGTTFKIYKIDSEGEDDYDVTLVFDGTLKFDGCSDLDFGKNGSIHFCETDDLICLNKSLAFIWERARKTHSYAEFVDEWIIKNDGISTIDGNFKINE